MLSQIFTAEDNSYTLEYPRMWEMEMVEGIPAFFDPMEGKGALQILSLNLDETSLTEETLKNFPYMAGKTIEDKMIFFLHMQDIGFQETEIKKYIKKGMEYIPFEYNREGTFYLSVMMQKNKRFLLVMYNSSPAPGEEEAKTIGEIVGSIEIKT